MPTKSRLVKGAAPAIVETATTPPPILSPNGFGYGDSQPPGQTLTRTLEADPRREYVAAPGNFWLAAYLGALPNVIDDVTRDFGPDLYERMALDSQVASCLNVVKYGALPEPVELLPVEDAAEEGQAASLAGKAPRRSSDRAKAVCDFCRRCLDNIPGQQGFYGVSLEMLDAVYLGNKVAELLWDTDAQTEWGRGKYVLSNIRPKPRNSTAFVVDAFSNLIGLVALIPGHGYPGIVEWVFGSPDESPNLLPREKFAILSFLPHDGDPRGTSLCRPAWNAWYLKQQTWGEYLKYLTRFAGGLLWGETAPNASPVVLTDASGVPQTDPTTGQVVTVQPEAVMLSVGQQIASGSFVAVPSGAKINTVPMPGSGQTYIDAIELYDRQIAKAVTGQTLATEEGQHQARAASETHQDILGLVCGVVRQMYLRFVREDILKTIVRYNFGDGALGLIPIVSVAGTQQQDVAPLLTALAAAGYSLEPGQFGGVDSDVGMPARAPDWQKRQAAQAQAVLGQSSDDADNANDTPKSANDTPKSANDMPKSKPAVFAAGGVTWITVNGQHVPIGEDGKPQFGGGAKTAEQTPSRSKKSILAKQSAKHVGADIQRYSEEQNEPVLAKGIGGKHIPGTGAMDVEVTRGGRVAHGIELKTVVDNKASKITMKASALKRKADWGRDNNAPYHTVVFDDQKVKDAFGPGQHDDSQRQLYYKRGAGSFNLSAMHKAANYAELNSLMDTPDDELPVAARPPKSYVPPQQDA